MAPNLTSWGGNTIQDPSTGKYHIYVSAMTNECPLSSWGQNSRIEHGVADTITGPYKMVDVAIPTWAHNSAPIALKDGTYANIHIGNGNGPANGGKNCPGLLFPSIPHTNPHPRPHPHPHYTHTRDFAHAYWVDPFAVHTVPLQRHSRRATSTSTST